MTISVNIAEAKTQLSHLIERMQQGETVRICKRNEPVAELVPVKKTPEKRLLGLCKGQARVPPEFFEPMPEEELALWYDAPLCSNDSSVSNQ